MIPFDDPVGDFNSNLFDIVTIVFSSVLTEAELIHLDHLIESHNKKFLLLFDEDLKLKHHMMTHYSRVIREMGPLKLMSCEKFEANHRIAKDHAKMAKSRINILLTLANKMQFKLAERFYSSRGLTNTISFGPEKKNKVSF